MGNDWFYEYFINELKAIGRKPTSNMQHEVVDSLPSSGNEQTIYFVKNDSSSSNNHYDEYVWISTSNAFEKIGSTQIDGSTTQPDWNQNDATQPDYVKNRPFYTGDPVETELVEETAIPFEHNKQQGIYVGGFKSTFSPIVGETYKVSWDGTVHECACEDFNGLPVIGNLSIPGFGSDSGEPFIIVLEDIGVIRIATTDTSASHTISIMGIATPVVKIDPKYIRDMYYTADPVETVLVEESVVTFEDSGEGPYFAIFESTFVPTVGETYKVSWDGSVYESTCLELGRGLAIGNLSIKGEGSDTGEPFLMIIRNGREIRIGTADTSASHTISISGWTTQVVKIDEKYLPDTVATKSDVEVVESAADNAQTTANNAKTAAENAQTTANNAKTAAENAQTTANNAKTAADNAQTTANNAKTAADNAVKYTSSQNLTDAQKQQARTNIGAGTSSFSGSWNDLTDKPFKPAGESCLTFSSLNSFTLKLADRSKYWDGILEYFTSDRTWAVWDGTSTLSAVYDDGEYVLYLRGTGNTVIIGGVQDRRWILTGTDIVCIGNIENLLDYATVKSGSHPSMADYCYYSMFHNCASLIQAPALPATTLANNCYNGMFKGCTSLTQAPALPATTLANSCYYEMFQGCTSLTEAPALPATTLADNCYRWMFSGCASLTQAPALPATTLAKTCYYEMFQGCTSLTEAPALPATTLADNCYSAMFQGCTSLTQATALPATTLADSCYSQMFLHCTNLTKAPALPATTLADNCYRWMFSGCASLTQAPALPATTLAKSCYQYMFRNCTSLKLSSTKTDEYAQEYRIPSSGNGTTATDALRSMFDSTGGTFTGTPEINTTYYLSSDNMIVRETDIATLNGYVGSMINNAISEYADTAEYIIHSSTEGSTKKFKITVDDTGTISATEVTS